MKKNLKILGIIFIALLLVWQYRDEIIPKNNETIKQNEVTLNNTDKTDQNKDQSNPSQTVSDGIKEDGQYTSKDEVALYIHTYKKLPSNYITKSEAMDLGWDASKGNLDKVAKGKSIGGDRFSNREGTLPSKKGIKYYECDIDYKGGHRNALRIVYSNQGDIFYTKDHYKNFERLY